MTFKIMLIDAMNQLRVQLENDPRPNSLVRGLVNQTLMPGALRIWVWDGVNANQRRKDLYPPYKANRTPARTDIYKFLHLLRDILNHTSAWQARLDGFEGDDVIAALLQKFKGERIEIVTTDRDMLSWTDGALVTCTARPHTKVNVPTHFIKLYKMTVGDTSDNIKGVPGFGDKSWAAADKMALAGALDKVEAGLTPSDGQLTAANLGTISRKWLARPEARAELGIMKRVIEPLPISPAELESALWQGTPNEAAREALMREFLL